MATIKFTLNGKPQTVDVNPQMTLLWVLRDTLGMTGTKFGCGMALCGACTVHIEGIAMRACAMQASGVAGKNVTTIEASHPMDRIPSRKPGWSSMFRNAAIASRARLWESPPCWRRIRSRPMPISMR
jgi:succinate dehydrogenase/fumarate reductase-like Fe-S protein